jgi:hypothetical protein
MQVVVETPEFLRRVKECGVSDAERAEIVDFIAANPMAGDEISRTGGARKVRFAGKGRGKSGGHRVVTFYSGEDIPVFLITMFTTNEKMDLTPKERNALKKVLPEVAKAYKARSKKQ